ncbi:MAG: ABC transporter substrate-binding protein [Desulfobacterales bacterium]
MDQIKRSWLCALLLGLLMASPAARAADPLAVVDQMGRRLRVVKPFERIISLYGAHTENLFALGLDGSLIGVSRSETYPPQALARPVFSYREDPERLLALRPDLVLTRPMIDGGYPHFVARLEQMGITVASLQPAAPAELYAYWRNLGRLTGRLAAAEQLIARFETAVNAFRALTREMQPKKRVYFEAIHRRMKTFTPQSTAIFVLETAGGINAAPDAEAVRSTNIAAYGKERILDRGREIDVYLAQVGTMNKVTRQAILDEPGFQTIEAVQTGEVHLIDETLVSRPTLRLLLGIYQIGLILYPEIYTEKGPPVLAAAGLEVP